MDYESDQKHKEMQVRQLMWHVSRWERTVCSKASFLFLSGAPNMWTASVSIPDGTGRHKQSPPVFTGTLSTSFRHGWPDVWGRWVKEGHGLCDHTGGETYNIIVGVQSTSCDLFPACSKCSCRLGYTPTEGTADRELSLTSNKLYRRKVAQIMYYLFTQLFQILQVLLDVRANKILPLAFQWHVVFQTISLGSVIENCILLQQLGWATWVFFWVSPWDDTILPAIKCEMNPR